MSTPAPHADHPEYNATVTSIQLVHDDLMILRVEPDGDVPDYEPGQYTTLGLFTDEARVGGMPPSGIRPQRLIRRAYSISCPLLDAAQAVLRRGGSRFLEFYIALVRNDDDQPPSLTPRLFALTPGHRLFMGLTPRGHYTLAPVSDTQDVIFVATGTGEAPHNAMIRDLLNRNHQGRIASVVCVRRRRDLGYLPAHLQLEACFENYKYVPITTREPQNLDRSRPDYVGKQYVQELFASGDLERQIGWIPTPGQCHFFLCGNPAMIGAPRRTPDGTLDFPDPKGMVETLTDLGFQLDQPGNPGDIHFEKYW